MSTATIGPSAGATAGGLSTAAAEAKVRLREFFAPVAGDLVRVEETLRETLRNDSPFIADLVRRVQMYGGKRLRPALLLLAGKACGGTGADHRLLAACVELIHVATLVHDDVLDESDKRRHVATVNAEWGTESSLLLGDWLFTHAFQLAASASKPDACRRLAAATNRICAGELHQVSRRGDFALSEAEHLAMLDGKTAELFAAACGLGARFAGGDAAAEAALERYGRGLGVAFQIADDVLDLLGDEATTGKTVGSDLRKQKLTLPLIRLRDTAAPAVRTELQRRFEQPGPDQNAAVARMLLASDALDYAHRRGREQVEAAVAALAPLPPSPARSALEDIARFALDRTL